MEDYSIKNMKHAITWMNLVKHYSKWKKPDTKGFMLHDSIYIKCLEKANL